MRIAASGCNTPIYKANDETYQKLPTCSQWVCKEIIPTIGHYRARNQDLEAEFTDEMGANEKIKNYLLNFVQQHKLYDQKIKIINHWVGILGFGSERVAIIKMLSPRIGVAVRLSGVGIAIGTLIGNKAAEMILVEADLRKKL